MEKTLVSERERGEKESVKEDDSAFPNHQIIVLAGEHHRLPGFAQFHMTAAKAHTKGDLQIPVIKCISSIQPLWI